MRTKVNEILKDFERPKYEIAELGFDRNDDVIYCSLVDKISGIFIEFDIYKTVRKYHPKINYREFSPKEIDLIYRLLKLWGWLK